MASSNPAGENRQPSADELRRQMRQIRREMGEDVEVLVEHAERLMDWRYYIHRYPWGAMVGAALIGYLLVPRRNVMFPINDKALDRLAQRIPVVVREDKKKSGFLGGLMGGVFSLASSMALKYATAYAQEHLGRMMQQRSGHSQHPVETHHG